MPLYDYRCRKGHTVEVLLKSGEKGPASCERCGTAMVRVVAAPAALKVRGGRRRRDIRYRRKGQGIDLLRKGSSS